MTKRKSNQPIRPTKVERRRERREEQRRHEEARARNTQRTRIAIGGVAIVAIAAIIFGAWMFFGRANAQQPSTTQATPTPTPVNPAYPAVDNVSCEATEQLAYHIHTHLTIYMNGKQVPVSQGIGIASDSSCIYWLHTHSANGVIHIESPTKKLYTLGNFLDLWGGQFTQLQFPSELGLTSGWKVYVDGKLYDGDFRQLELKHHELITMAYNSPGITPDTTYSWGQGE